MRILLCILSLFISHTFAVAQGYVLFANRYSTLINAPVLKQLDPVSDGLGPGWSAQLFLTKNNSLTPLYPISTFRPVGTAAIVGVPRYWFTQTNEVPGVLPGQTATFIVRAWKNSFGSYEAAAAYGYVGESLPVTITVGDAENPAPLIGLEHFRVGPFTLPPATLAIASTGSTLNFSIHNNGAPFNTIEISSDLMTWHPYLALHTKLDAFQATSRLPPPFGPDTPAFFRLRLGIVFTGEVVDGQFQTLGRYRFKFERVCFCRPFSLSGAVQVNGGRIVSVTNARADDLPLAAPDITQFKTIEDLYALIATTSLRADLLVVTFDPVFRYPRVVDIDYILAAADDEITYNVSEFQRLNF